MDNRFARGARVKPKEERVPLNVEMPFHEFMACVGIYSVRDYKVDKATFLQYCEAAYEGARRSLSAEPPQTNQ